MKTPTGRTLAWLMGAAGALAISVTAGISRAADDQAGTPPSTDQPAERTNTPPSPGEKPTAPSEQAAPAAAPSEHAAPAPTGPQATTSSTKISQASVTVAAIDRAARKVTVKDPDGEKYTIEVPQELAGFDRLKVGDHVDLDYYQAMAVSILPPGSKPSMSERKAVSAGVPGKPGSVGRQLTVSAKVVKVDPGSNEVTFKGPKGETNTVKVDNPDLQSKLPDLKPGDVVQLSYTEAVAAEIRPATAQ